METEHRISQLNPLFEARLRLRKHADLETDLIARIAEIPKDDFCHSARESFQLGAGFAYLRLEEYPSQQGRETELSAEEMITVFDTFFAIQPRNRYLTPDETQQQRKEVTFAVLHPETKDTSHAD